MENKAEVKTGEVSKPAVVPCGFGESLDMDEAPKKHKHTPSPEDECQINTEFDFPAGRAGYEARLAVNEIGNVFDIGDNMQELVSGFCTLFGRGAYYQGQRLEGAGIKSKGGGKSTAGLRFKPGTTPALMVLVNAVRQLRAVQKQWGVKIDRLPVNVDALKAKAYEINPPLDD